MIWITSLCLLAVFAWLVFNGLNERRWVQAHAHDETVASDEGLLPSLSSLTGSGGLPGVAASAGAGLTKTMHTVREKSGPALERVKEKSGPALEKVREKSGPALEKIKEKSGPTLEKVKEKSGPALEKIKEKSGPALEKVKEKSGPAFEKVKEKSGPAFDKIKEKSVPALEKVKEKSGPAFDKVKEKSGEYKNRLAERRSTSGAANPADGTRPTGNGDGVLGKLGAAAGTAARKVDGGINAGMRAAGARAETLQTRLSDKPEHQSSLGKAFGKMAETTGRVGSSMGEKARQRNETGDDGFFTKLVDKVSGK